MRHSGLSPQSFDNYYRKLLNKGFLKEMVDEKETKQIMLTEKGSKYIKDYKTVSMFIKEFEL
jgi:predicted transcriptional regulator